MNLFELQSFFFTKQMIEQYVKVDHPLIIPKSVQISVDSDSDTETEIDIVEEPISVNKFVSKPPRRPRVFVPRKKDTLFWCFYVIIHGFSQYEYPGNNSFENEKTEKIKFIELLRKKEHRDIIKKYKLCKNDIEDDLANKERITPKTFVAFSYIYKLNILFIHRRKCYRVNGGHPDEVYHIIHQYDPPHQNIHGAFKYAYDVDALPEQRSQYLDNEQYISWEIIDKPLKAISNYKVSDLHHIAQIYQIDCKGKTKTELYQILFDTI